MKTINTKNWLYCFEFEIFNRIKYGRKLIDLEQLEFKARLDIDENFGQKPKQFLIHFPKKNYFNVFSSFSSVNRLYKTWIWRPWVFLTFIFLALESQSRHFTGTWDWEWDWVICSAFFGSLSWLYYIYL